jgi:hypothetical protein
LFKEQKDEFLIGEEADTFGENWLMGKEKNLVSFPDRVKSRCDSLVREKGCRSSVACA